MALPQVCCLGRAWALPRQRLQVLKERRTGSLKTCKAVQKSLLRDAPGAAVRIKKLCELRHPLLCGFTEVLEDLQHYFLISPKLEGGDVGEWLEKTSQEDSMVEEHACAAYIAQVLVALAYCHGMSVYHLDLRSSSVLLTSRESDARAMLSDTGLALALDPECPHVRNADGAHIAPELRRTGRLVSGGAPDLWSVGSLAQAMLIGDEVHGFAKDSELWAFRSKGSRNFVRQLLQAEGKRPTAAAALQHPWLRSISVRQHLGGPNDCIKDDVVERLVCYMQAILLIPVELAHRDLDRLRGDFVRIDLDSDGFISAKAAQALLVLRGSLEVQARRAVDLADVRGTGVLEFSALAAAALLADMLPTFWASCEAEDLAMRLQKLFFEAFGDEKGVEPVQLHHLQRSVMTSIGRLMENHSGVNYAEVLSAFDEEPEIDRDSLLPRLSAANGCGTPLHYAAGRPPAPEEEEQTSWLWPQSSSFGLFRSCGLYGDAPRTSRNSESRRSCSGDWEYDDDDD
eukprot:TRINITY_DN19816_c0_g1_i2.p1 TRINITY_DN19816_c0_g1~~TRINITY_DN19816_c0_g1_i2.p1  ORF type:complete len:521 (-),score=103.10 TRINITY_DN19816_c0_g1_i2:73-1611(-)